MTSTKSRVRRMGRNIRRATGAPLPIAMQIAKILEKSGSRALNYSGFSSHLEYRDLCGDPGCCGSEVYAISGPKGILDLDDVNKPVAKTSVEKPIPYKYRFVKIRIENIDAALKALRDNGFTAEILCGIPVDSNGSCEVTHARDFVQVKVNASARRVHETLLLAKLVKPVGSRDRKFLAGMRVERLFPVLMTV